MIGTIPDCNLAAAAKVLPAGTSYYIVQEVSVFYNRKQCPGAAEEVNALRLGLVAKFYEAWFVPENSNKVDSRSPDSLTPSTYTDRFGAIARSKSYGRQVNYGIVKVFILSGEDRPDVSKDWKRGQTYLFPNFAPSGSTPGTLYSTSTKPAWWDAKSVTSEGIGFHEYNLEWSRCCDPPNTGTDFVSAAHRPPKK